MMKTIDTFEYVSVLKELTEAGQEVSMLVAGNSMSPFLIHQRDYICFKKPDRELRAGDMVFFQRPSEGGRYIMHRIWKVRPEGYYIVGDGQQIVEGPVKRNQIFAIITRVQRKGKWVGEEDLWWKFFQGPWRWLLPARPLLRKAYGIFQKLIRR